MKRSIVSCILLTLITCGFYSIYWLIVLNDDINRLSGNPNATSGGMVILLNFITCGIYGLYWFYKMGCECDRIRAMCGGSQQSYGFLFLLLGIFSFGIVNYCLMQDIVNNAVGGRF